MAALNFDLFNPQVATAKGCVNAGGRVRVVVYRDNRRYELDAIAGDTINTSKVLIFKGEDGKIYAYSEQKNVSPVTTINRFTKRSRQVKKEKEGLQSSLKILYLVTYGDRYEVWVSAQLINPKGKVIKKQEILLKTVLKSSGLTLPLQPLIFPSGQAKANITNTGIGDFDFNVTLGIRAESQAFTKVHTLTDSNRDNYWSNNPRTGVDYYEIFEGTSLVATHQFNSDLYFGREKLNLLGNGYLFRDVLASAYTIGYYPNHSGWFREDGGNVSTEYPLDREAIGFNQSYPTANFAATPETWNILYSDTYVGKSNGSTMNYRVPLNYSTDKTGFIAPLNFIATDYSSLLASFPPDQSGVESFLNPAGGGNWFSTVNAGSGFDSNLFIPKSGTLETDGTGTPFLLNPDWETDGDYFDDIFAPLPTVRSGVQSIDDVWLDFQDTDNRKQLLFFDSGIGSRTGTLLDENARSLEVLMETRYSGTIDRYNYLISKDSVTDNILNPSISSTFVGCQAISGVQSKFIPPSTFVANKLILGDYYLHHSTQTGDITLPFGNTRTINVEVKRMQHQQAYNPNRTGSVPVGRVLQWTDVNVAGTSTIKTEIDISLCRPLLVGVEAFLEENQTFIGNTEVSFNIAYLSGFRLGATNLTRTPSVVGLTNFYWTTATTRTLITSMPPELLMKTQIWGSPLSTKVLSPWVYPTGVGSNAYRSIINTAFIQDFADTQRNQTTSIFSFPASFAFGSDKQDLIEVYRFDNAQRFFSISRNNLYNVNQFDTIGLLAGDGIVNVKLYKFDVDTGVLALNKEIEIEALKLEVYPGSTSQTILSASYWQD